MKAPVVNLVLHRVLATAEVRSVVAAQVATSKTLALAVPARRGPPGTAGQNGLDGNVGPPGPPAELGENVILDGGNF